MDKHAFSHSAYCTAIVWGNIFNRIPDWGWGIIASIYGTNFLFWVFWIWTKLLLQLVGIQLSHREPTNRLLLLNLIVPFRIFWRP